MVDWYLLVMLVMMPRLMSGICMLIVMIGWIMCMKLVEIINLNPDADILFWKCIQELGDKSINGKLEWPCQESVKYTKVKNVKNWQETH